MENTDNVDQSSINVLSWSFTDLPIINRLEYVKNIIFSKGGDHASLPADPALVVAARVLDGVIEILQETPAAAELRKPNPKLGTLNP
jgi:hypothetical protein